MSLRRTITDKKNTEVVFVIDSDDVVSKDHLDGLITDFPELKIHYHITERSEFVNGVYLNWAVQFASGKYLWALGDDVEFRIRDWDTIVKTKIEKFLSNKPDRIAGVGVQDNTPKPKRELPKFPCFPLVTREAYNFFGFIVHPEVPCWGADYLFYLLYTGGFRYFAIDDKIYLRHISWHIIDEPRSPDPVAKRVQQIFAKMQHIPKHNIDKIAANVIPGQITKLLQHLKTLNTPKHPKNG